LITNPVIFTARSKISHPGCSGGRLEDVHPVRPSASEEMACGRPPRRTGLTPLLSRYLCRPSLGLAGPLPSSSYHPAQGSTSPSCSSPGSPSDRPGHLIDPSASGHLWSPLDGVGDHLSWGLDEPMFQGYLGGTCCRRRSCRSGGSQVESGCKAGGHGDRVTKAPAGPQPGKGIGY
jgi:hypothetical protein